MTATSTRRVRTIRAAIYAARSKQWDALSRWTGDRYYKLFRRAFMRTDLGLSHKKLREEWANKRG